MEFRDLKAQYKALQPQIDKCMQQVCENANFISGNEVTSLEKDLALYVGTSHCISCANGTDALSLVLMGLGITKGDGVFVPDFTFFASGEVVSFAGATPIFVDVNDTFNIDTACLEKAILDCQSEGILTPRAIIAVDLFGQPADYVSINAIAKKYGLLVIEDAAQGFGGAIGTQKSGSFGVAATTSFFPAKPLGCYGDGGAIFTNDDALCQLIKSYAIHGKGEYKYDNVRIGINSRLDTLQGAILKVKLDAFKEYELEKVNNAASFYNELLAEKVKTPRILEGFTSSYAQYTIILKNAEQRQKVQEGLKKLCIPTMVYYPKPMHKQTAFENTPSANANCPYTQMLCNCVLSLPIHPYITKEEQQAVANGLLTLLD